MNTHKTNAVSSVNCCKRTDAGIKALSGIKVTIHIPQDIPESIMRQKINKIYDILNPETS